MTATETAAYIQGTGWGLLLGSQAVRIDGVHSAYLLVAAGVVILAGMLLERHGQTPDSMERETA